MWTEDEGSAPYLMNTELIEATKKKKKSAWS